MRYPHANFADTTTIRFQFMGHWDNTAKQITWPCDLDLWPWTSWRQHLMQLVVLHSYTKFEVRRPRHSEDMAHDVCQRPGDPDLWPLTLKLVCESHLRWGTFLPNLAMLGLWVLESVAIYATDRQKQRLQPMGGGIIRQWYDAVQRRDIMLLSFQYNTVQSNSPCAHVSQ